MDLAGEKKYFEESFKAHEYLKNYYAHIDAALIRRYVLQKTAASETARIMIHMAEAATSEIKAVFKKKGPILLELGGGPTIYQLLNIISVIKEVHFTDYTQDNLNEIVKWLAGKRGAFNWSPYIKAALMLENDSTQIKVFQIKQRENLLRRKITKVAKCDIFLKNLGVARRRYDIISTHFVAESATSSKVAWRGAIKNISKKLAPGGLLFMSALLGAKGSYKVLDKQFPAVELYEKDVEQELRKNGFKKVKISSMKTEDLENNYKGFMFIIGEKR